MKQLFLCFFALLFFTQKITAQSITFEDSTFTEPVIISDFSDGVSFENCHFVGITADAALTLINVTGSSISGCTFENITGNAVVVRGSDFFSMYSTTMNNVTGSGFIAHQSRWIEVSGCQFSNINGRAFDFSDIHKLGVTQSQLSAVGSGLTCFGSGKIDSLRISDMDIHRVNGLSGEPESGYGIRVANAGVVTINLCTVDSCMGVGMFIGQGNNDSTAVDTISMEGNHISRTNLDGLLGQENVHRAYIHDNEISYSGFMGGQSSASTHGIRWQAPGFRIEDNRVHHAIDSTCGQPYCGAGISIGNVGIVARNRVYNCTANGIEYVNAQSAEPQYLHIFNNIVYDVTGNPILIQGDSLNSDSINILIRNNTLLGIFHGDILHNAPLAVCCNASAVTAQGNILLFEGITDTLQFVQTYAGATLTENLNLKATETADFVNYTDRDFHLLATATAIDFLPAGFGPPNDDIDHEPRDPKHDAGADEFPAPAPDFCGCVNCPNFIPDNFVGDFFFYVAQASNNNLADSAQGVCGVRIHFDHEYVGDLTMRLFSPSGQSVLLVGPTGFFGPTDGTDWDVLFVPCADTATPDAGFSAVWTNNNFWDLGNHYQGSYYPAEDCLENFNAGTVSGIWRLAIADNQAIDKGNLYDFKVFFCDTSGINCLPCLDPPMASLLVNTNDWDILLHNNSTNTANTISYQLDFGDSLSFVGSILPVLHTYSDTGTYLLRLIATNQCGADTFEQTIHIAGALPNANAVAQPGISCVAMPVQIKILSSNYVDEWHWLLPGAVPEEAFVPELSVTYSAPGVYPAILIVSNTVGADTTFYPAFVEIQSDLVTPGFTVQIQGDSIIATNTTQGYTDYLWTINGTVLETGSAQQQIYIADSGTYVIKLYVANVCDSKVIQHSVTIAPVSGIKNAADEFFKLSLLPNPNDGRCRLEVVSPENLPADLVVLNTAGQKVFTQKTDITSGKTACDLDLSHLPSGFYLLRLQTAAGSKTIPFTLQK